MVSWEVWLTRGKWGLYVRDYHAQGLPVDYHLFKSIDQEMAEFLVDNKLAGDLHGQVRDLQMPDKKKEKA